MVLKFTGGIATTGQIKANPSFIAEEAGPTHVTEGLAVYLDADDPASYPGSGTTWTDLAGGDDDFIRQSSNPAFVSASPSYFDSNTTGGKFQRPIAGADWFNNVHQGTGSLTWEFWLKSNPGNNWAGTVSTAGYLINSTTTGSQTGALLNFQNSTKLRFGIILAGSSFPNNTSASTIPSGAEIRQVGVTVAVSGGSYTGNFFVDGAFIDSQFSGSFTPKAGNASQPVTLLATGFTTGADHTVDARFYLARFYSTALLEADILQNFDANKEQFGRS